MYKVCSNPDCNKSKSIDDYYDRPDNKDGKYNVCKDCIRAAARAKSREPGQKERRRERYLAKKEKKPAIQNLDHAALKEQQTLINKTHPPIDLMFTEIDFNRVNDIMTKEGIKTFSGAFKHILNASLKKSRHFTPNAFSNSLSILDENRYQLLRIKNNLEQLLDGHHNGKAPGLHSRIDQIKSLIQHSYRLIERISKTIQSIVDKQP